MVTIGTFSVPLGSVDCIANTENFENRAIIRFELISGGTMKYEEKKKSVGNKLFNQHENNDEKSPAVGVDGTMNAYLMLAAAEHGGSTDCALLDLVDGDDSEPSDPAW